MNKIKYIFQFVYTVITSIVITTGTMNASPKSDELTESSVEDAGFRFPTSFYTVHSPTFCKFTSVVDVDTDVPAPSANHIKEAQLGNKALRIDWKSALISKTEIADELVRSGQKVFATCQASIEKAKTGFKLFVAAEFLGKFSSIYCLLTDLSSASTRLMLESALSGIDMTASVPLTNTITYGVSLGSKQCQRFHIRGLWYGTYGFEENTEAATVKMAEYGFTNIQAVNKLT